VFIHGQVDRHLHSTLLCVGININRYVRLFTVELTLADGLQHIPAPDDNIRGPLTQFVGMGLSDVDIADLLKEHYDTSMYGLR